MATATSSSAITPETVVSTLLPHLTKQTSKLPTLHAQLGLPTSALESDLRALRDALLKTIEDCVHTRQKEIQDWADRCDGVEDACLRLSRALGAKAASFAEIKKQTVWHYAILL